jgi:hypothetical protein
VGNFSDNGGWPHDGGAPDDLPDLPDEWGVIVIPDDLSELSDEVRAVRAELALTRPRTRWERFATRPAVRRLRRLGAAGVRAPVLIISMAVLVTVASLFASAWPGPARSPATQRTATSTDHSGGALPALELIGPDGATVALRRQLPAVILLTDGCDCEGLVADTITAVSPSTAVVTVTSARPSTSASTPPTGAAPQAQGKTVLRLSDPTTTLRGYLRLGPPDGTAAALVVSGMGEIVRQELRVATIDTIKPAIARL